MTIEKTFIINLENRIDRLVPLIDYLKKIDLEYWVFQAIRDKNGRYGLLQSVKKVLTECLEKEYSCVMILEDDCNFIINPKEIINKGLEQLPQDFDLYYLGCNLWQSHVYKYSENLIQLDDAYATQSIIYSKNGMQKVLTAIEENEKSLPLDVLIKEKVMPDNKTFCSFPLLTTQVSGMSDIEGKIVNYSKFIEDRFKEKTAHL